MQIPNVWSMTKKMKIENVLGKDKILKIFNGVRNFFGNRGKSETERNASLPQGYGLPHIIVGDNSLCNLVNSLYLYFICNS